MAKSVDSGLSLLHGWWKSPEPRANSSLLSLLYFLVNWAILHGNSHIFLCRCMAWVVWLFLSPHPNTHPPFTLNTVTVSQTRPLLDLNGQCGLFPFIHALELKRSDLITYQWVGIHVSSVYTEMLSDAGRSTAQPLWTLCGKSVVFALDHMRL